MSPSFFSKICLTALALCFTASLSYGGISAAPTAGTYNGLVTPSSGTLQAAHTTGFFNAVVTSNFHFTGKLTLDGQVLNFTGAFSGGQATFNGTSASTLTLTRTNMPSLLLAFNVDPNPGGPRLVGTVTQKYRSTVTAISTIVADIGYYDGKTPGTTVPAAYLGASNADGSYTVVLPAADIALQPAGFTTADYPLGTGYGTLKITKAGVATFAATLADGTAVTIASALAYRSAPQSVISLPLFAQLYNKAGFISARVVLDSTNSNSDLSVDANKLKWSRPFSLNQYYPYGWPEVIVSELAGAKYTVTPGQSVFTGLVPPGPGNPGNAYLAARKGRLTSNFDRTFLLSSADVVTNADTSFSVVVTRATGFFSGSFLHTDGTKPAYKGVVYQKGTSSGGLGFFLSTSPKVLDYAGESGSVAITTSK